MTSIPHLYIVTALLPFAGKASTFLFGTAPHIFQCQNGLSQFYFA